MANPRPSPSKRASSENTGAALTQTIAGDITDSPNPPSSDSTVDMESTRAEEIARAAYYRAERRGFESGHDVEDWLAAEKEISERDGSGAIG